MIIDLILQTGTGVKDFLTALTKPIQTATTNTKVLYTELSKRAKFNGRKMVLQSALNDIFSLTGIIVETQTSTAFGVFTFNESEGVDIYSFNESEGGDPIYVFNESEVVDTYDFLVKVPIADYTAELDRRIRAEVRTYKLAGKTFNVVTY